MGGIGSGRKATTTLPVDVPITGTEEVIKLKEEIGKLKKEVEGLNDSFENLDKKTKESKGGLSALPGPLGAIGEGIETMTKVSKAFIATGFGLILAAIAVAIAAVGAAFTNSEEGQNKFAKITAVISSTFQVFMDILAKVGDMLIGAFENPQKALKDLGNLIKDQIVNRVMGLLELLPALGKAVMLALGGKFKEAGKVAFDAATKVGTGIENLSDKLEKIGDKIADSTAKAKIISDKKAAADIAERAFVIKKADLEDKIAAARDRAADKEGKTVEQRKKDLMAVTGLENKLFAGEKEEAQVRADIATEELTYKKNDKAALDDQAKAIAKVAEVDAAYHMANRKNEKELARVDKEEAKAEELRIKEKEKQRKKEEKDNEDDLKFYQKIIKDKQKEDAEVVIKKEESDEKVIRSQMKVDQSIIKGLEQKQKAQGLSASEEQTLHDERLKLMQEETDSATKAIDAKTDAETLAVNQSEQSEEDKAAAILLINQNATDQINGLKDIQLQHTIDNNDKEIAEAQKKADKEAKIGQQALAAATGLADGILDNEINNSKASEEQKLEAAKKKFKIDKASALVTAAINTAVAVTAAAPVIPLEILAAAMGAASIAAIASKTFTGGDSSGGNSSLSVPTSAPQSSFVPPQITNMNAPKANGSSSTTSGQNDGITRAYVVGSDISKSQDKAAVLARRTKW